MHEAFLGFALETFPRMFLVWSDNFSDVQNCVPSVLGTLQVTGQPEGVSL